MTEDDELKPMDHLIARVAHPEGNRPGDDFLQAHGVLLPCTEQFGLVGWDDVPPILSRCDRPYGHTGAHMAEGSGMSGGRTPSDDERTNAVLRQIAERKE